MSDSTMPSRSPRSLRLTARNRLTLLYVALVLAAGVALTALTYLLMRESLAHREVVLWTARPDGTGSLPPQPPSPSALSQRVRDETLAALLTQAGIALAVVTVLAGVLGWLLAGRVLRPIRAISATAQRLSAENLSDRVPVHPPQDELAALAETVNGMLDRVQHGIAERDRALDSQKLFAANAAHELRTPLTTIRTAIDVTLDGEPTRAELLTMAEDVRAAAEASGRTLDGLLVLARSQAGTANPRPVDLAEVARAVLADVGDQLSATGLTLHQDLSAAHVTGEPVLLERMTANLVGNALRYNYPGGHVTVSTGTSAGTAALRVLNSGLGVPPGQVDRLLEPFVRGEGSRTSSDGGAGLGLSIVQAVVLAHDGVITSTANRGGGLDVTVRLPPS
ncbi:signal transduction histidine kinase [Promicromonospora sp. AC04]|uniref:sensor histidine kinase n=1 Tax=Promicromonospora sp. AC04 TaxID=2135723 RepID=UPI000D47CADC|nr:HAMP domain-containing sensor histidine kinase [Promicromonospora sp. AC04]PUB26101.1 signal transduction histidine kinase [Promicromonospora sp. AC04]